MVPDRRDDVAWRLLRETHVPSELHRLPHLQLLYTTPTNALALEPIRFQVRWMYLQHPQVRRSGSEDVQPHTLVKHT